MPELSLQRQQNVLTAIATDQDLVYLQVVSGFLFQGVYLISAAQATGVHKERP